MVLLTMTAPIVEALGKLERHRASSSSKANGTRPEEGLNMEGGKAADEASQAVQENRRSEPSLSEPALGKPISHGQIIDISKKLKELELSPYHLDILLRGSKIYVPPPPPKPEPKPEYKALMARLRKEEEARAYERMINPPPSEETFSQRFPTSSAAHAFSSTAAYASLNASTTEEDDMTYEDVSRQVTLIFNVLISIFACAAAIWIAARWWDTPARLALSMSGSLLVGIAEVVVYTGYIRRLGEAKEKEGKVKEVREIIKTWVVGEDEDEDKRGKDENTPILLTDKEDESSVRERKRTKEET
jgi:hypothetical protein